MTETSTSEPATRILDLAELKKHTTETDCYLLYNGKVYDVTEFLDEHPGGAMEPDICLRSDPQARRLCASPADVVFVSSRLRIEGYVMRRIRHHFECHRQRRHRGLR